MKNVDRRSHLPFTLALLVVGAACAGTKPPASPPTTPSPSVAPDQALLLFESPVYQVELNRSLALTVSGHRATEAMVKEMQQRVARDPSDLDARIVLLAYCEAKHEASGRREHLLWLITQHPDHPALRFGMHVSPMDGDLYLEAHDLWTRQLAAHPTSVSVLVNAASFYSVFDGERALSLYAKARAIDPTNVTLMTSAAEAHMLRARTIGNGKPDPTEAAAALADYQAALEHKSECPFPVAGRAAKAALAAGQPKVAAALAEQSIKADGAMSGDEVHAGNIVLGKLALEAGDVHGAAEHLVDACKTTATPVLRSFGPDMTLATDLLQRGERQAVIEYLDACTRIWDTGRERLIRWKSEIERGAQPELKGAVF
jgi:tetratricopeptide (TPR) repeat protein